MKPKVAVGLLCALLLACSVPTGQAAGLERQASAVLTHYIRAVLYERSGQAEQAIREYRSALRYEPDSVQLSLNLAFAYLKKDDAKQAVETLKQLIQKDPAAVEPHVVLALIYSTQNRAEEANNEYELALRNATKLEPENIDIYKTLGLMYVQRKKFEAAEQAYTVILKLAPGDAETHFYLADVFLKTERPGPAEEQLRQALKINPEYPEALNYLGYLLADANRNIDEAEALIRRALKAQPENGAYLDSLGWVYFRRGKLAEAKETIEKASTLLEDPVIFDHLGDVYFALGDAVRARENWERALALSPQERAIEEKIKRLQPS